MVIPTGMVGIILLTRVHLRKVHSQHSAAVLDRCASLEAAERGDLADVIPAVFLADVLDQLVAPIILNVEVDVGHFHALGV